MVFVVYENTKLCKATIGKTVIVTYIKDGGKLVATKLDAIGCTTSQGTGSLYGVANNSSSRASEPYDQADTNRRGGVIDDSEISNEDFQQPELRALNNDAVIRMVKAGQPEDKIVSTIITSPGRYDSSAQGLKALKDAGASKRILATIARKAFSEPTSYPGGMITYIPILAGPSEEQAARVERRWSEANAEFLRVTAASQGPCDEGAKRAIANAESALEVRTAVWKEFFQQRRQHAHDAKQAATAGMAHADEELRTSQATLIEWTDLLAELKRKRLALEGESTVGFDPEDLKKARSDLDAQISASEQGIANLETMVAGLREAMQTGRTAQADGDPEAIAASARQLIEAQYKMYSSIYRANDVRFSLGCRPGAGPAPPSRPQP
jgi:hypothetical protein